MILPYSDIKKALSYALIVFIIYSSSGSSDFSNDKNLTVGGWVFFTFIYFYYENYIKLSFILLLSIFLGTSLLYFIINGAYNQVTYLGFFMKIMLAYYCKNFCKEDFFDYFVNTIYIWTSICIVLYCVQLISFDFFFNLNNFFGVNDDDFSKSNSLIFTMTHIHYLRNCGFMWEPGAFVTVLVITFYINLFYREEPLFSRKNTIFLIAIMTAQSTMGVIALLIPLSFLLKDFIMKNRFYQQLSVVIIPAVLIALITVFTQVDFLFNKMVGEIVELDTEFDFIEQGVKEDFTVALSRTASVILDMKAIKQYPLLGLGIDMRTNGFSKLGYSDNVDTSCGLTILVLRFGFIGFIIYNWLLYRQAFFERTLHKIGWVVLVNFALFTQEISASSFFHLFIF